MVGRQLVSVAGVAYGPETLRVAIKAFDSAWADLAQSMQPDSAEARACQLKLATIILAEAKEHRGDADALKKAVLNRLHAVHH
jgi:hypothetical protein